MKPSTTRTMQMFASVVCLTIIMSFTGSLIAQEARGTITGKVRDAGQAVVPGATVDVTNVAMNTTVSVATNDAGFFRAPYLCVWHT